MNWQPGQEYKTRDGRRVRVYAVDGSGYNQIHGAIYASGWNAMTWGANGIAPRITESSPLESGYDLMPPPPVKHVKWLALIRRARPMLFDSSAAAADFAYDNSDEVIACLRIEYEEGEGL